MLWAVPRSRSTAFERVFVERDDFAVIHEPFSATYYRSVERRSDEFLDGPPDPDATAAAVLADVLEPREQRTFVKDMAYHATAFMDAKFVGRFVNTFLIRHPREALASLHARHPEFTFEEAGYEQLARCYDLVATVAEAPPVVDAADLMRDAHGTMRAYCDVLDIPFVADALTWEPRDVDHFSSWDEWHDHAQHSTGFGQVEADPAPLSPELDAVYAHCLPLYERLHAVRIRANG